MIRNKKLALPFLLSAALLTVSTTGCRVKQTQEGDMPDVKVEGGQVPKYDVDAADVDVKTGTEKREVTVPTVDVDVKPPADGDQDPPNNN
ncbi:MAG TPA: hypothetical protein VG477_07505 [Thermoanaerobaculia bacterium]|nr:hypothetical protein [Thermoanaerobaculia bacterium]